MCVFIADLCAYICMLSYSPLCANFGLGILVYICACCICERLVLLVAVHRLPVIMKILVCCDIPHGILISA